jgi:Gpi18-like mannosyltransferase
MQDFAANETQVQEDASRNPAVVLGASIAIGLVLRLCLLCAAPQYAYFSDHADFAQWGVQAARFGPTSLYTRLPPPCEAQRFDAAGRQQIIRREKKTVCNYPPLSIYCLWALGETQQLVAPNSRINNFFTRCLYAIPTLAAELVLAMGCRSMLSSFWGARTGVLGFAAIFLCPPLVVDGAFWGQLDAWLLAPTFWMVFAIGQGRWRLAGLLWGIAMGLKTQGIIWSPVWLLALLLGPNRRAVLGGMAISAIVLNCVALPFWLTSGVAWIREGFVSNLLHKYPDTTLKAFNVWYLDLLLTGIGDSTRLVFGFSRDTIGRVLLAAGLCGGYLLAWVRWRNHSHAYLSMASWVLLSGVMFPTRVHERYLILTLPFLICSAFHTRRLWYGVAALTFVALLQVTWPNWSTRLADQGTVESVRQKYALVWESASTEQRGQMPKLEDVVEAFEQQRSVDEPTEYGMTLMALLGAAWTFVGLALGPQAFTKTPHDPPGKPGRTQASHGRDAAERFPVDRRRDGARR